VQEEFIESEADTPITFPNVIKEVPKEMQNTSSSPNAADKARKARADS